LARLGWLTQQLQGQDALWGFCWRIDMKSRKYDGMAGQHAAHQQSGTSEATRLIQDIGVKQLD
jgi:hypothetical protein